MTNNKKNKNKTWYLIKCTFLITLATLIGKFIGDSLFVGHIIIRLVKIDYFATAIIAMITCFLANCIWNKNNKN